MLQTIFHGLQRKFKSTLTLRVNLIDTIAFSLEVVVSFLRYIHHPLYTTFIFIIFYPFFPISSPSSLANYSPLYSCLLPCCQMELYHHPCFPPHNSPSPSILCGFQHIPSLTNWWSHLSYSWLPTFLSKEIRVLSNMCAISCCSIPHKT